MYYEVIKEAYGVCMNRIRLSISVALMILVTFLFVSCNDSLPSKDTSGGELVEAVLNIEIAEEKALHAHVDLKVTEYRYTAVPLFTLEEGAEIFGVVSSEKSIGADGEVSLGYFTQGHWRFHVFAYNKDGYLIREGEKDIYLFRNSTGSMNKIPVTLLTAQSRTGKCHFLIKSNKTQSLSAVHEIGVTWTNVLSGETSKAESYYRGTIGSEGLAEETITYDFTILNLKGGIYEFRISLWESVNGTKIRNAGQIVSTTVIGEGGTSEIEGTLYPNEWVNGGFELNIPVSVNGSVCLYSSGGKIKGDEFEGTLSTTSTFIWEKDDKSYAPAKFQWYVNGSKQEGETKASFSFTPSDYGNYTISCTTEDETGFEMGYDSANLIITAGKAKTFSTMLKLGTTSYNYSSVGKVKNDSLISLTWTDQGSLIYSGYPTFSGSTDNLTSTITALGKTITLRFIAGTLSVTGITNENEFVSVRGQL